MAKKKILLQIVDMHCTSCTIEIDGNLEDLPGVVSSKTHYAKQVCEVEFEENDIHIEKLLQTIAKSGYTAIIAT